MHSKDCFTKDDDLTHSSPVLADQVIFATVHLSGRLQDFKVLKTKCYAVS